MRDPTGFAHEGPSQRLAGLAQLIAAVRGSPIECCGTMDLILRNERGERWRILQADQAVYLHPGRARRPHSAGMEIGVHDHPDVVLEVDNTTDVRRGKLGLYEEWGFPEVWVEVPARHTPGRPADLVPGLVIRLLEGGRYLTAPESRAFLGWTAEEIHTAMSEPELSAATSEVLTRVGRALGALGGTNPDHMPRLRAQRREARAEARASTLSRGRGRAPRLARNARARVSARAARADRGDGRRSRRRPPADVGGTMLICIPPSGGGTHLGDLSDFPAPPQSGRALSARPAATRKTTGFLSEGYRVGSACALGFFVYASFSVVKSLLLDRLPARAGGQVPSPTLRTFFKGCRMRRCFAQLS